MRYYGKKPLLSKMQIEANRRTESKDAVCWTIYPSQRRVRIKLQGSDEYVYCDYPQNWKETPEWLRVGQAVSLRHTSGRRGRLEIVGRSLVRPTAQPGSTDPVIPTPVDAIISGLQLIEVPGRNVMKAGVSSGRARFSGATSSVIYLKMTSPAKMVMGYAFKMGQVADVVTIEAAPSSGARYDLIVVGSNLVFDVVKGTASSSPVFPGLPANHLQCGWILITDGTTAIKRTMFNQYYADPIISLLSVVSTDDVLDWGEASCDITVTLYDQYGNEVVGTGLGNFVTLTIAVGNGTVDDQLGNSSTSAISKYTGETSSATFTYTRDQASGDHTPTLVASVAGAYVTGATVVLLLDDSGDPM